MELEEVQIHDVIKNPCHWNMTLTQIVEPDPNGPTLFIGITLWITLNLFTSKLVDDVATWT